MHCELLLHESYAIRFNDVVRLLDFYEPGHPYRTAYAIYFCTGMRVCELDNLGRDSLVQNILTWNLGKNQKGTRSVVLPPWLVKEIHMYIERHPTTKKRLFPFSANSLTRKLYDIREELGGNFLLKVKCSAGSRDAK